MSRVNGQKLHERASEAKIVRKIVFYIAAGIGILLIAVIGGGVFYVQNALEPVDPDSDQYVEVNIPLGSSVAQIGEELKSKNLIKSPTVFRYYVKYKNESGFQAGDYELSPSMAIDEIIAHLKQGQVNKEAAFRLTIREGLWMTDIAEAIAEETDLEKDAILRKMKDRQYIENTYLGEYPFLKKTILDDGIRYPLEGYLFPATYAFAEENPSLETIVKKMLDKTGAVLNEFETNIEQSDFSIHQVLTLASLIEEEGTNEENRRKISSVFHNRLEENMPLQSNPTVNYAVQKHRGWIEGDDINVDSSYNTYIHKGLPIGPVANPGKDAIEASLNPIETDYYYFIARVNGEILFSKTYEKHEQHVEQYKDEWEAYSEAEKNKK